MTGDSKRWRVVAVASKSGPYKELSAVAAALGVAYDGGLELDLLVDGRPVKLSLEVSSGVVGALAVTVELDARGAETPHIELRKERDEDREGKAHGITREVQTGYEPFDGKVFVDNEASEADAVRLLAAQATRDAVLGLLEGECRSVRVTPRAVTASCSIPGEVFPADRVLRVLEQTLVVARAGGPRDRRVPRRGAWLWPIAVAFIWSPLFLWLARSHWHAGWTLHILGAVPAVLFWGVARPVVRWIMSGDSSSYRRYKNFHWILLLFGPFLWAGALLTLNGALDRSPAYTVTGTVSSLTDDADNDLFYVRWSDGTTTGETAETYPNVGDAFVHERHAGALGFEWYDEDPEPVRRAR